MVGWWGQKSEAEKMSNGTRAGKIASDLRNSIADPLEKSVPCLTSGLLAPHRRRGYAASLMAVPLAVGLPVALSLQ